MKKSGLSSKPSSRSQSPAGGQPRTGGTGTRPTTPVQGGGLPIRSGTPVQGGQARTDTRPATPVHGASGRNSPVPASRFSSDSSDATRSPSPAPKTTINTTATAVPKPTSVADHLGGLRIKVKSDKPPGAEAEVGPNDPLFLTVAAAVNLGFKQLESHWGKDVLIGLGVAAVNEWDKKYKPHLFPHKPATNQNMAPYVTAYLREIRANVPPILVTNGITGEGATIKYNWAQPAAGQPNKGLDDYVASEAGLLQLNKFIFENIVESSKQIEARNKVTEYTRAYEIQMGLMGLTVAHEMCHFFVGYLAGYAKPNTPPEIRYLERDMQMIDGEPTGESGRWWEGSVFGGETRFFAEPQEKGVTPDKHPLGYRQAGDLWLLNRNTDKIAVIDRKCITALLNFDFDNAFPFETVGEEENLLHVKKSRLWMHQLRNLALGREKDYKAPIRQLTKQQLEEHNKLRRRDFNANAFRRLAAIPSHPRYIHHDLPKA